MAITLPAALKAQLDTENRAPIIEFTAEPSAGTNIPFVGVKLHETEDNEGAPDGFVHSSGSYVAVYQQEDETNQTHLYLKVSDDEGLTWGDPIKVTSTGAGYYNEYPSCCELSTQYIGILWTERYSTTQKLRYMVVTKAGATITAATDLNTDGVWYESSVSRMSNSTVLAVGARYYSGNWQLVTFRHAAGNWVSWTSAHVLTYSGDLSLNDAIEKRRPFVREIEEISSLGIHSYNQWIFFDRVDSLVGGVTQTSIYYVRADDYFVLNPVYATRTNVGSASVSYIDPSIAQYVADEMMLGYVKKQTSLLIDTNSSPALGADDADYVFYDGANDLIVIVDRGGPDHITASASTGVLVLDASDFSQYRRYSPSTTPAISVTPNGMRRMMAYYKYPYVLLGHPNTVNNDDEWFDLINIQDNTVKRFYCNATALAMGSNQVKITNLPSDCYPSSVALNDNYIYFMESRSGDERIWYFDHTSALPTVEASGPFSITHGEDANVTRGIVQNYCYWDFDSKSVYIVKRQTAGTAGTITSQGFVVRANITDGAIINVWRKNTLGTFLGNANFPAGGGYCINKDSSRIYISAWNDNTRYPGEPTGLIYFDLNDTPSTASMVNYCDAPIGNDRTKQNLIGISRKGDGKMILCTCNDGVGTYNPGSNSVIKTYDKDTVIGFPTGTADKEMSVNSAAFDYTRARYMLAVDITGDGAGAQGGDGGLLIFDQDGDFMQPTYKMVTNIGTSLDFAVVGNDLTALDEEDHICLMRNRARDGVALMWRHRVSGLTTPEYDIYFDEYRGVKSFDLRPYLTDEWRVTKTADHQPSSMEFVLSRGDLFDPLNAKSLLRSIVDTGAKICMRKGERTPSGDFLIDLFTGYVETGAHSYVRGNNPSRRIIAYDITKPLYDGKIPLSPSYGDGTFPSLPDGANGILVHLGETVAGLPAGTMSIGSFGEDSVPIEFQLTNMSPADMLEMVANRFMRVVVVDGNGHVTVKKIAKDTAVSATISSNRLVVEMNPDESEGENTNQVCVRGVSDREIDVMLPYVSFGVKSNSYYNVVRAPTGGIEQYFAYAEDWSIVAGAAIFDWFEFNVWHLDGSLIQHGELPRVAKPYTDSDVQVLGWTKLSKFSGYSAREVADFLNVHGARLFIPIDTSERYGYNYKFHLMARPLAKLRVEFQMCANDYAHQRSIRGMVVGQSLDFPLAKSEDVCRQLAEWLLYRVQLGRKIARIRMLGHLENEVLDVIRFKHPESGHLIKSFIHEIVYRVKFGDDGYDLQEMTVGVVP